MARSALSQLARLLSLRFPLPVHDPGRKSTTSENSVTASS
jgi:hypothetical protein